MLYDTKELDELLYALAKLMNSGKASFADGQITFSDGFNFVDDVMPVWNGISGAQLILVNLSEITDEQKESSRQKFLTELNFSPEDETAFDKVLVLLFSLVDVLVAFGAIPSAPVPPEGTSEENAASEGNSEPASEENTASEETENPG